MRKHGVLILAAFFGACAPLAAFAENKVQPPKKIEHDGLILIHNTAWQDQEAYIETDLDGDPDKEILITFISTYKPKKEAQDKESSDYDIQSRKFKEEIPIIQNYAFAQVYDKKANGFFECVKTFSGMDRPARVEIKTLDGYSAPALFIFSPGGERYTDFSVYQWENGGFRLIFNIGSANGISLEAEKGRTLVHVGKEETYAWNPAEKRFRLATP